MCGPPFVPSSQVLQMWGAGLTPGCIPLFQMPLLGEDSVQFALLLIIPEK